MTKNVNKVPRKAWGKWSKKARMIFNDCYKFFMENQELMNHPKAGKQKPVFWKTVAWNSAWIAADACDKTIPTEIITV